MPYGRYERYPDEKRPRRPAFKEGRTYPADELRYPENQPASSQYIRDVIERRYRGERFPDRPYLSGQERGFITGQYREAGEEQSDEYIAGMDYRGGQVSRYYGSEGSSLVSGASGGGRFNEDEPGFNTGLAWDPLRIRQR